VIKHKKRPNLSGALSLERENRQFLKTVLEHSHSSENISLERDTPVVKLAFSALLSILGPSNLLFLAQIILLYSKSSILPRNLQLTQNLGIKCYYSNKDHKKCKKV